LALCKLKMKVHICTVDKLFSPGAPENYALTARDCFWPASEEKIENAKRSDH
jgi:hypothetical protein